MEGEPVLLQVLQPPLLSINEDNNVGHLKLLGLERLEGFKDRDSTGDQILNNEAVLTRFVGSFNCLLCPVILHFLAPHHHGEVKSQGHAGCNGEGGVGDTTHNVKLAALDTAVHDAGHLLQDRGVGDNDSEVDVHGTDEA